MSAKCWRRRRRWWFLSLCSRQIRPSSSSSPTWTVSEWSDLLFFELELVSKPEKQWLQLFQHSFNVLYIWRQYRPPHDKAWLYKAWTEADIRVRLQRLCGILWEVSPRFSRHHLSRLLAFHCLIRAIWSQEIWSPLPGEIYILRGFWESYCMGFLEQTVPLSFFFRKGFFYDFEASYP